MTYITLLSHFVTIITVTYDITSLLFSQIQIKNKLSQFSQSLILSLSSRFLLQKNRLLLLLISFQFFQIYLFKLFIRGRDGIVEEPLFMYIIPTSNLLEIMGSIPQCYIQVHLSGKLHSRNDATSEPYKPAFHGGHLSRNTSHGGAATLWVFRLPRQRYSYSTQSSMTELILSVSQH